MVVRLKDTIIDSIDDTETRRLKLLSISSKSEGATISLELPEALSATLSVNEIVNVTIDSKPIVKGESAKLYVEGTVFKKSAEEGFQMVGSVGGLRLVLNLAKATASQIGTFGEEKFYMALK